MAVVRVAALGVLASLLVAAAAAAGTHRGGFNISQGQTRNATLFVSPTGSGGACSRAAPCRSWDAAYHAARPGDVVDVAAGEYPAQALLPDPSKTSSRDVVFRRSGKGAVIVAGLDLSASHVEIQDATFTAPPYLRTLETADDVTLRRDRAPRFTIAGSSNVRVLGGVYGPYDNSSNSIGPESPTDPKIPRGILLDGVTIHGFHRTDGTSHVDCLLSWGVDGLTIRRSVFYDCEHFDILLVVDSVVGTPTNVVIEDNFLDCCRSGFFSVYLGDQDGESFSNILVRNNSSDKPIGIGPNNRTVANLKFVGNIAPSFQGCGRTGVEVDYNVWYRGEKCGSHDIVAAAGFRSIRQHDFHLVAHAAAINRGDPNDFSPVDIDGQHRPLGGAPDAGADERR